MKIFYGYGRKPKDAPPDTDRHFIDDETTDRQERHDLVMFTKRDVDVPDGDDIYVLAWSDLGKGAEAKHVREALEAEGNRVHLIEQEKPVETRGRPAQFKPDPSQDKKIKTLYRSFNAMSYVLDRVEQIMGQRFEAHHLKRRYGNRWKK